MNLRGRKTPLVRLFSRLLPLSATLLLAGCVTTAPTPPAAATPAPVAELPPASITGFEEASAVLDNFTVFVSAIDGVPVEAGRTGWKAALPLKAGLRRLTLTFNRGVFVAQAEVELAAASDAAYQVRFATDAQFLGGNTYCDFWIVDTSTGQPVTSRLRAPLKRIEARNDTP
jgi:hypothetical protein